MRYSGDTSKIIDQELFVWDTVDKKNAELNTVGMPTGTEMLYKNLKKQKEQLAKKQNVELI